MGDASRTVSTPRSRALLVGPAIFLAIWSLALVTGLRVDYARDRMMQFVGVEELASVSFIEAWRSIHMQPPGFNMLLKAVDSTGDAAAAVWLTLLLIITLATLWMVGDIVLHLTRSMRWAMWAGVVAAVVPGTLYYSLWVFYTQISAFLLTVMVWGLVVGMTRARVLPFAASVAAAAALFTVRSTYVWVVVVAWLVMVVWLAWRRTPGLTAGHKRMVLAVASVGGAAVVVIQVAALVTFGSWSQSSWAFENAAKAVMTQVPEAGRVEATRGDSCLREVLDVGVFEPIDAYPSCARQSNIALPESSLLDSSSWVSGYPNMNQQDRLALAQQWRTLAINMASDNPIAVLRIPFPNWETQERGTLFRFMWPSSWYWLIESNVNAGGLAATTWIVVFSGIPAIALLGIVVSLFVVRRVWSRTDVRQTAFVVSCVTVLGISGAYLYLETGENERFRAEIDFLLISLGAVGWWLVTQRRAKRQGRADASTVRISA
jgi:hypothetical protein